MFRKLGFFAILLALALPAWPESAKISAGTISGYVRDRSGAPQMGAVVEILGAAQKAFTDDHGFYSISSLIPGIYSLKVSAPAFLPTLREKIGVRSGARLMVNVTLTNLFEAIQLVTVPPHRNRKPCHEPLLTRGHAVRSVSNVPANSIT